MFCNKIKPICRPSLREPSQVKMSTEIAQKVASDSKGHILKFIIIIIIIIIYSV